MVQYDLLSIQEVESNYVIVLLLKISKLVIILLSLQINVLENYL